MSGDLFDLEAEPEPEMSGAVATHVLVTDPGSPGQVALAEELLAEPAAPSPKLVAAAARHGISDAGPEIPALVDLAHRSEVPRMLSLAAVLPQDFNLVGLLQFLPDVKLKRDLDAAAASALALKVAGREGVQAADKALGDLKDRMRAIDLCFDGTRDAPGPTALAHQLHSRLTGLRGDFKAQGTLAVATLATGIAKETKRLDDAAAAVQREEQEKANAKARADAARAAEEAKKAEAPAPLVAALEQAAQTAVAPPVATTRAAAPVLAHSSVVEKQKARLLGTADDAEPNPAMADLTDDQRASALKVVQAVADGKAPLSFLEFNWTKINARAEGSALGEFLPGLEAFKARSTRGKARR